jgi:hypothetical protein
MSIEDMWFNAMAWLVCMEKMIFKVKNDMAECQNWQMTVEWMNFDNIVAGIKDDYCIWFAYRIELNWVELNRIELNWIIHLQQ